MDRSNAAHVSWPYALHCLTELGSCRQNDADIYSWNAILSACDKAQHWRQAAELCATAIRISLQPDVASCSALIRSTGRRRLWQESLVSVTRFLTARHKLNRIVYNAALSSTLKWSFCINGFEHSSVKIQPDVISFNAVITACDRSEMWCMALFVFSRCCTLSVETSLVSLGALLSTCQSCSRWFVSTSLMNSPKAFRSNVLCNSITTSFLHGSVWHRAFCLVDSHLCEPDLVSVNTIMAGSTEARWQLVLEVAEKLTACACRTWDSITYNSALNSWQSSWEVGLDLIEDLSAKGLQASTFTISGGTSLCGKSARWQVAAALQRNIQLWKLEANVLTCNAVLSASGHQWLRALEVLFGSFAVAIPMSQASCGSVIQAISACEMGRWSRALTFLKVCTSKRLELFV